MLKEATGGKKSYRGAKVRITSDFSKSMQARREMS